MKILELTNYSAGICGVWQRVKQEAIELNKKGHEVRIFTSNLTKGSGQIASSHEKIDGIQIFRFPARKIGGEAFMSWNFESAAIEYSPDIIIAHSYRHPHTMKALRVAKRLKKTGKNCKVFLVTHAPFITGNTTRSWLSTITVNIYDKFVARTSLNKFDKIINITLWEVPILLKIGIKKEKLVYIPNGIPDEFFKFKVKKGKNILFLGRISPVKELEILIEAVKDFPLNLDIVGPAEEDYLEKLKDLIRNKKINNANFLPPVYDLNKKIKLIDNHEIFVLPSRTEAMPQSLIEAMSRGKIAVSSSTNGGKEIILDSKNGFLFEIGNVSELIGVIKKTINLQEKEKRRIIKNAIKTSERFKWSNLIKKLEGLF